MIVASCCVVCLISCGIISCIWCFRTVGYICRVSFFCCAGLLRTARFFCSCGIFNSTWLFCTVSRIFSRLLRFHNRFHGRFRIRFLRSFKFLKFLLLLFRSLIDWINNYITYFFDFFLCSLVRLFKFIIRQRFEPCWKSKLTPYLTRSLDKKVKTFFTTSCVLLASLNCIITNLLTQRNALS